MKTMKPALRSRVEPRPKLSYTYTYELENQAYGKS